MNFISKTVHKEAHTSGAALCSDIQQCDICKSAKVLL